MVISSDKFQKNIIKLEFQRLIFPFKNPHYTTLQKNNSGFKRAVRKKRSSSVALTKREK
ncbi:hypothetical protein HDE70_005114 [Pedobacter cryoconitis]|nr:hypothetical protein [Pedobacter cryoconitis]